MMGSACAGSVCASLGTEHKEVETTGIIIPQSLKSVLLIYYVAMDHSLNHC